MTVSTAGVAIPTPDEVLKRVEKELGTIESPAAVAAQALLPFALGLLVKDKPGAVDSPEIRYDRTAQGYLASFEQKLSPQAQAIYLKAEQATALDPRKSGSFQKSLDHKLSYLLHKKIVEADPGYIWAEAKTKVITNPQQDPTVTMVVWLNVRGAD